MVALFLMAKLTQFCAEFPHADQSVSACFPLLCRENLWGSEFNEIHAAMKYLHTMVRVSNLEASLRFYCDGLGLREVRRKESTRGRFTLVFLASPADADAERDEQPVPMIELTYNWDPESYQGGRNFGHLAYEVDDIYALCSRLSAQGVVIHRPPRDGHMAFVRSPDGISVELLQRGDALASQEPWASMKNSGAW